MIQESEIAHVNVCLCVALTCVQVLTSQCMSTTEPKEKRQRVQSEDDSVPASTIASPLCMCSTQSVNALTRLLHTCTPQWIRFYNVHAFKCSYCPLAQTLVTLLNTSCPTWMAFLCPEQSWCAGGGMRR